MRLFGKKKQTATEAIVLRGFPGDSNTNKCLLMAAEQGIRLETRLVDVTEGACEGPEYRSLSPFGKVPCIKDGDFVISGAPAVLAYMDVKGKAGSLNPKKASILGEQNYWVDMAQRLGDPAVQTLIQHEIPGCAKPTEEEIRGARESLEQVLDQLETLLADDRGFITGLYSFADIHWTPIAHLCVLAGQADLIQRRAVVNAWYERVSQRTGRTDGSRTYLSLATLDEIRNKQLKFAA